MAQKNPLASVPFFDLPEFAEPKNPTGIGTNPQITDAYKEYIKAREDAANKLEQRYAKPNYFQIAAGFLKPQLGGFSASLGSANEALAEQAELERAIAPTVAQMRSRIALSKVGLAQGQRAAEIAEKARGEGRVMNPTEAAEAAGFTSGPGAEAEAGQQASTAQFNQLIQAISQGASYTEMISKLPKAFVDANLPLIIGMIPGQKPPPGTPSSLLGGIKPAAAPGTPATPPASAHIPGVPVGMTSDLPISQQLKANTETVAAMQQEREKLNANLTQQATTSVPIFEAATNLYKAASNPALAGAFGVFEKGDPLSILGKGLESGSFPAVIEKMRTYITQARLGADEKKRAISDLQAMENTLQDLRTKMNQGLINQTDLQTMVEGESIPGVRNTQDAFLRGIARIGSDALARYESKAAFDKALQDPKFNVMTWASSPYFSSVQENAKKRTQALITNPASVNMPKFMQSGLSGAYRYEPSSQAASKPTASSNGTPKNRPNERVLKNEKGELVTWVRQPDNTYKVKE